MVKCAYTPGPCFAADGFDVSAGAASAGFSAEGAGFSAVGAAGLSVGVAGGAGSGVGGAAGVGAGVGVAAGGSAGRAGSGGAPQPAVTIAIAHTKPRIHLVIAQLLVRRSLYATATSYQLPYTTS